MPVGHFFWILFAWPQGIVVGNLIASVIWATPAFIHLHRRLGRQHAERLAQAARHHHEQMKAITGSG